MAGEWSPSLCGLNRTRHILTKPGTTTLARQTDKCDFRLFLHRRVACCLSIGPETLISATILHDERLHVSFQFRKSFDPLPAKTTEYAFQAARSYRRATRQLASRPEAQCYNQQIEQDPI